MRHGAYGPEANDVPVSPAHVLATYRGRRVLVTGHTGFKGSWITAWLAALGASVTGLSLEPDQGPDNLFDRAQVADSCQSLIGDIRDLGVVQEAFATGRPEVVLHLAAQPLVQRSYADPIGTITTNVLGTAHVLEAARMCTSVRAVVCVTTDKVYRNHEWPWPYRETDELGGYDPYSASKAAAEMIVRTYRTALLPRDRAFALTSARGGNVLGGGDWSANRLIPDVVRALRSGEALEIRNPQAVRPWQHVLDLCYAYLLIGTVLIERGEGSGDEGWNFGPDPAVSITVRSLVDLFISKWGATGQSVVLAPTANLESHSLALDSSLARAKLGWRPVFDPKLTIQKTSEWYKRYAENPSDARMLMDEQRTDFEQRLIAPAI